MVGDNDLVHFGVRGMRWGTRKIRTQTDAVSDDHANVSTARAKAKRSGTKSLSNKELQDIVTRLNLEQQYRNLNVANSSFKKGHSVVKEILSVGNTLSQVAAFTTSPSGKLIKAGLAQRKR